MLFRSYVFHAAFGREGEQATRVTIDGTRHVVQAAIRAGAEAVVVLSSTSVFGDPGGESPIDETAPYPRTASEYESSKAKAEQIALELAAGSGRTRVVVISPACIYGPRGATFTQLPATLFAEGRFCWVDDGRGLVNYVYVTNLVDAILRAAVTPAAHGHRFIACDGTTTWRAFFTELFGEPAALEAVLLVEAPGRRRVRSLRVGEGRAGHRRSGDGCGRALRVAVRAVEATEEGVGDLGGPEGGHDPDRPEFADRARPDHPRTRKITRAGEPAGCRVVGNAPRGSGRGGT